MKGVRLYNTVEIKTIKNCNFVPSCCKSTMNIYNLKDKV